MTIGHVEELWVVTMCGIMFEGVLDGTEVCVCAYVVCMDLFKEEKYQHSNCPERTILRRAKILCKLLGKFRIKINVMLSINTF